MSSSQASRNTFSKFTFKPSALSQLTANFNKKLEQVPVPKIDSIDLVGRESNSNQENINKADEFTKLSQATTESTSSNASNHEANASKEFVFGENITERVVNVAAESEKKSHEAAASSSASTVDKATSSQDASASAAAAAKTTHSMSSQNAASESSASALLTDDEKYTAVLAESDMFTLFKLSCKLYVLEADKVNWAERGYGILKIIETSNGSNCKIMMWTDKCYRIILNTKLFEKMKIDQANKKSLRLNAFDNGTIRIFLIKTSNQNDCDELYNILSSRLAIFNAAQSKAKTTANACQEESVESKSSLSPMAAASSNRKITRLKCDCTVSRDTNPSATIRAKIHLYSLDLSTTADSVASPPPILSNSHQLLLDIYEANDSEQKISLNSYLKLVKIKKQKMTTTGKHGRRFLEFEVIDLAQTKSNIKYKVRISDREAASQFLTLYKKEPKFTSPDDSSSNGTSAFDRDLDDSEVGGADDGEDEDGDEDDEEEDEEDDDDDERRRSDDSGASSADNSNSEDEAGEKSSINRTKSSIMSSPPNNSMLNEESSSFAAAAGAATAAVAQVTVTATTAPVKRKSEDDDDADDVKAEGTTVKRPDLDTARGANGGTKRNLDESVTSEDGGGEGDSITSADKNEISGQKKTKVDSNE